MDARRERGEVQREDGVRGPRRSASETRRVTRNERETRESDARGEGLVVGGTRITDTVSDHNIWGTDVCM